MFVKFRWEFNNTGTQQLANQSVKQTAVENTGFFLFDSEKIETVQCLETKITEEKTKFSCLVLPMLK